MLNFENFLFMQSKFYVKYKVQYTYNMNSLNKYFQFQSYKQIVIVSLYNISLNLIYWWKWLLIMQQTWLPLTAKKFMTQIIPV